MSHPKQLHIKESIPELKRLQRKSIPLISVRIRALIEIKQVGDRGISKRELADKLGVNHNSIQYWRSLYERGGIESVCSHGRKGFKPSILSQEEHVAIENKLRDPLNGLRGYVELKEWIEQEFKKQIKYNTLLKYSIRNFGSKVKVARKSHVKKDESPVTALKKTSHENVVKS